MRMILEICSQAKAKALAEETEVNTSIISITSMEEKDAVFSSNPHIASILRLKLNDLTKEYDEEGIPYGRPLPEQKDLAGLREFVTGLRCERLIVHCWEGTSRSAAVAAAIYEARCCVDSLRTFQRFSPNPLVYRFACRELGIRPGDLRYSLFPKDDHFRLLTNP